MIGQPINQEDTTVKNHSRHPTATSTLPEEPTADQLAAERERAKQEDWAEVMRADMDCFTLRNYLGSRYAPSKVGFARYEIYADSQRPVIARLKALLPDLPAFARAGRNLLFGGGVGTGKDFLMATMIYRLAPAGVSCRWINGPDLFGRLREAMHAGCESSVITELATPTVLCLSDPIPSTADPRWSLSQLGRIVDERYRAQKATWVTANVRNEQQADERLSALVFDRLRQNAEIFWCPWSSYRERPPK